jgi:LPXTG-motif cell wall-anchored protein
VTTKAQLPATGGNDDAMLFALIAGALLVVGGLPTAGRWIVRKASR